MRHNFSLLTALSALTLTLVAASHDAHACGGGIFLDPSSSTTVVEGHRVVISMSSTQTVLWDQVEYSGNPKDFAWILPVKKGATVEVGTDAWLEVLDPATTKVVRSPEALCGGGDEDSGGGCACGSALKDGAGGFGVDTRSSGDVNVVHSGTAGPYETVTLEASMGNGAVGDWLTKNGYAIPADVSPILDKYVADGFDFIALRLKPDAGVAQMKPIRVVTPGAGTTFPLRMLSAGTKDQVDLVLYVLSEGRIEAKNFPNGVVDSSKLVYDFGNDTTNYLELRDAALAAGDKRTFLTAMARPGAGLLEPYSEPFVGEESFQSSKGEPHQTIAEAFFVQTNIDAENDAMCNTADQVRTLAQSADKVVDTDKPAAGEIAASTFACGSVKDLAVAFTGMHPKDVWLTRLEARLPRTALAEDLTLGPASSKEPVERHVDAKSSLNSPCASATVASANGSSGPRKRGIALGMMALGVGVALLRRRMRAVRLPAFVSR